MLPFLLSMMQQYIETGISTEATVRYSRQAIVPGVGVEGQQRLLEAKVAIVGLGGLGSPVLQYLAMAGVGEIGIIDNDFVEIHNLQRQSLHRESTIGFFKTSSAATLVRDMNSSVVIREHRVKITEQNIEDILREYTLILDCTDSLVVRYIINDYCRITKKTLISGAVLGWEGQVCVLGCHGLCYRCIFHGMKKSADNCDQSGVVGPMCGLVGSLQAVEALKAIIKGVPDESKVICLNGLLNKQNTFTFASGCTCNVYKELPKECWPKEAPEVTWAEIFADYNKYQIVDLREEEHYKMIRARGSIRIDNIQDWIYKSQKPLAIVCYRGNSAAKLASDLRTRGVEAYKVAGGIQVLLDSLGNKWNQIY